MVPWTPDAYSTIQELLWFCATQKRLSPDSPGYIVKSSFFQNYTPVYIWRIPKYHRLSVTPRSSSPVLSFLLVLLWSHYNSVRYKVQSTKQIRNFKHLPVTTFFLGLNIDFRLFVATLSSLWWEVHLLTYSMEQLLSWEANWFAASQETPRVLWNPKVPHSQAPATCLYPEPAQSSPHTHIPLLEYPS
jgi:hypothetical protein